MNKKTFFCMIALAALLLIGCGQNNNQGSTNSSGSNSASESEKPSTTAEETQNGTKSTTQSNTTQNGSQEETMISEQKAKEIALTHAGLTADQVTFVKSGIDMENGRKEYDVEFFTKDQKEYDYEIDPYTGEVLNYDYDAEYHMKSTGTTANGGTTTDGIATEKTISTDEAKQIALAKVPGATASDIREFKSEYDNSKLKYEGKIYYDHKEYEFEIDGANGTILEWDVESIYG